MTFVNDAPLPLPGLPDDTPETARAGLPAVVSRYDVDRAAPTRLHIYSWRSCLTGQYWRRDRKHADAVDQRHVWGECGAGRRSTSIGADREADGEKAPQQALTKGTIYPIVKKVATVLGVQMTKQIFAKSAAKIVPLVGAAVSGSLTFATFLPMSKRLRRHLASLPLTKPSRASDTQLLRDTIIAE